MGVSISRLTLAATCAAVLTGCQTYREAPFDAAAFDRAWSDRAQNASLATRQGPTSSPTTQPFAIDDGLSLAEARALALFYNPTLRLARLRAGVARATADHAGRWADPSLGVDAERIVRSVDEPWVVGGTLNLTLPLSGRLDAERDRAGAAHAAELVRVAGQEWATMQQLAADWADFSAAITRVERLDALIGRLDEVNRVTDRLAEAGSITRLAARVFRLERATRQAERIEAVARRESLRLGLLATIGLRPDAAVVLTPESAPFVAPPVDAPLVERNFAIRAAAAEYDVAEQTLRREIRAQYPDLVVGPGFGTDEGDERVLLGLSLPLPLWNRNQQGVAEAIAGRDLARAELEATIEAQTSALAVARVRLEAARRQRALLETTIAPAADEQAADAERLVALGEVDAVLLLDAIVRQHDVTLQLLDARAAEIRAAARLAEIAGDASRSPFRPLPARPSPAQSLPTHTNEPQGLR